MKNNLICILSTFCSLLFSTPPTVNSSFVEKKISFGQRCHYLVIVKSNIKYQILTPDSSFNFKPFKILNIHPFRSRLANDSIQIDSISYELISFSQDSILKLQLPISQYFENDSINVLSNLDSICIELPKHKSIILENTLLELPHKFNYQLFLLITLPSFGFLIAFRHRLKAFAIITWKSLNYNRMFRNFTTVYEGELSILKTNTNLNQVEKLFLLWKEVMAEITHKPISTFTTREILILINEEQLQQILTHIDKCIYSGKFESSLINDLEVLLLIAKSEFQKSKNKK